MDLCHLTHLDVPRNICALGRPRQHESKARRNVSPHTWQVSACWEQTHAGTTAKFTQGIQGCKTSQRKLRHLSKQVQSSAKARIACSGEETRCEYIGIRTRRQIVRLVEHRGQRAKPRNSHSWPKSKITCAKNIHTCIQPGMPL